MRHHPHHLAGFKIQPQLQIAPATRFMPWKIRMTMTRLVPQHGCHPSYPHQCPKHQHSLHKLHFSNRPLPQDLSLMKLLLQVCPLQPHNQAHHHFQGCLKHQALSLIAQGHVLHHRDTVPWRHWCNTIFLPSKQHGLKTPWPPNLLACAKHWCILNLSQQNLPVSAQGCPLLMRDTALRPWIWNPANYQSIANSDKAHATRKFGTTLTLINLGISAKA